LKSWRIPFTLAANLMLMIQHMLKLNPDQTLAEAMTKAIASLQENEKILRRSIYAPQLR
jgi:hypothetical protein